MPRASQTTTETPEPEHAANSADSQRSDDVREDNNSFLDPRMVRWNFGALILDVVFFSLGMAFFDGSAVLPLLLERLGATGPIIGAFAAARSLAFNAFQVFVAYGTHGKKRQKPWLVIVATTTRIPLIILPFFLWRAADSMMAQRTALLAVIVIISLWSMGDGLGYVPWMEIIARGFSEKMRGRLFATTQLISGLATVAVAALVVRTILSAPSLPFPRNYTLLAVIMALMMQVSLIGVLLIREPPAPKESLPRPPLSEYFRRMPGLLRANPVFMKLCAIQLLVGFGSAASPFYVLYAQDRFHLSDAWGGTYQVLLATGTVALMPLWTFLSEKRGPASAVRGVAVACLFTPVLAMTLGSLSPWTFGLVFLLMGGSLGWGMWVAMNHYLLSHISQDDRPIFVSLLNLLFAPSAVYPFLGGLLVQKKHFISAGGIPVLFLMTSAVVLAGVGLSLRLPQPEGEE